MLGPLEFAGSRGPVTPTAPRQQVVLAVLLWRSNQVVPIDLLVDAVWGDSPPATARSQVQICVSNIRKSLARGGVDAVVGTRPQGYVAEVPDDQLDVHVFERLVAHGRALAADGQPAEAADRYAEALLLWRGRPFAGVVNDWTSSVADQLSDRRIGVVEEYLDLQITLGRSGTFIADLVALVEEYPYRERLWAQLMVSLYRAGRQADALRQYRVVRELFARELGLAPGPELRRLERDILAGTEPAARWVLPGHIRGTS